jgi:hypothetical protein
VEFPARTQAELSFRHTVRALHTIRNCNEVPVRATCEASSHQPTVTAEPRLRAKKRRWKIPPAIEIR